MTIEPISSGRLRVWLDPREVRRCRLDSRQYDRRALRRLVRRVITQSGGQPSAGTVAEMIPVADGWILLISPRRERVARTAVYWFDDDRALAAFTHRWERLQDAPVCAAYRLEGGYALVVYPDGNRMPLHKGLLDEYGQPWGTGEALAAHVAEYGQPVCAGYLTADGLRPPADGDREH